MQKRLKKTKILCTIGPSSRSQEVLREMIKAGMDVARVNFSHGNSEEHIEVMGRLRRLSRALGRPVAIMQDLGGPKIRVGEVRPEPVFLKKGDTVTIVSKKIIGNSHSLSVNYPWLPQKVKPGASILINDGAIRLRAISSSKKEMRCRVLQGGLLSSHKGVNLPDTRLDIEALTEKDKRDILLGLKEGVDIIALSFVRNARDIQKARGFISSRGGDVPIIAKIERRQALENLEEIMEEADGVMVARGDLGVETELEEVPLLQKKIIRACNLLGKPVITATQMLESMIKNPSPTRAEATDVANAVLDGTDALMLSGETAVGSYPVEALEAMIRIAYKMEGTTELGRLLKDELIREDTISDAVTHGACQAAIDLGAVAIIACTRTGKTARLVARYRPPCPIIAATPFQKVVNQLCLTWGVYPVRMKEVRDTDEMIKEAEKAALGTGLVKKGDKVVVTARHPFTQRGVTNLMKAHVI